MNIGNILQKIRELNGLTQEQFADKIGVKRTTYISYETSRTTPDFETVEKISKVFNVSVLNFFEKKEENKSRNWLVFNAPETVYETNTPQKSKALTEDEKLIINYYRILTDDKKVEFFDTIRESYLDELCNKEENNS